MVGWFEFDWSAVRWIHCALGSSGPPLVKVLFGQPACPSFHFVSYFSTVTLYIDVRARHVPL